MPTCRIYIALTERKKYINQRNSRGLFTCFARKSKSISIIIQYITDTYHWSKLWTTLWLSVIVTHFQPLIFTQTLFSFILCVQTEWPVSIWVSTTSCTISTDAPNTLSHSVPDQFVYCRRRHQSLNEKLWAQLKPLNVYVSHGWVKHRHIATHQFRFFDHLLLVCKLIPPFFCCCSI